MYQKFVLDNGLRLVLVPRKEFGSISVQVFLKSGSDYEDKNLGGLHHFAEHLPFKGTKRRPSPQDIPIAIESKGGEINAFTEQEIMAFQVDIASEYLELALDVLSDMLFFPLFNEEGLEIEKGVVFQEIEEIMDTPKRFMEETLWDGLLYGDQPAGWPIYGSKEMVSTVTRQNIIDHFSKYLRTGGVVISVVGNIDERRTRELVEKYFSQMKSGNVPEKAEIMETQTKPQVAVSYRNTEQTYIRCGFGIPGINLSSPERHPIYIITKILGGNMSSRLFLALRDVLGVSYSVHTVTNLFTDRGWLATDAGVNSKRVGEVIQAILKEYRMTVEKTLSLEELDRGKEFLKGQIVRELDMLQNLGYFHGAQELLLDKIVTPREEIEAGMKVTAKEVQEVASKVFRPSNLNLAVIGPHNPKESEEMFGEILNSYMK